MLIRVPVGGRAAMSESVELRSKQLEAILDGTLCGGGHDRDGKLIHINVSSSKRSPEAVTVLPAASR